MGGKLSVWLERFQSTASAVCFMSCRTLPTWLSAMGTMLLPHRPTRCQSTRRRCAIFRTAVIRGRRRDCLARFFSICCFSFGTAISFFGFICTPNAIVPGLGVVALLHSRKCPLRL